MDYLARSVDERTYVKDVTQLAMFIRGCNYFMSFGELRNAFLCMEKTTLVRQIIY